MKKIIFALSTTLIFCLGHAGPVFSADQVDTSANATAATSMFDFSGDTGLGIASYKSDIDSDVSGVLRLQLKFEPIKDISVTGRASMSKVFDSDYADDDYFWFDRFFFTWDNIADTSFSMLAGRLPTMEGTPDHLRLGLDTPRGILSTYSNIAVDGAMFTYSYDGPLPGSIRLFYGSQFDIGYESNEGDFIMEDTDIYGVNWDIFSQDNRLITLQSFVFDNLYNVPADTVFPNPYELAMIDFGLDPANFGMNGNGVLDRRNIGDIYVTSLNYLDKLGPLNYFVNLSWSHTEPEDIDEMGISLLNDSWNDPESRDGYSFFAGLRYDLTELHSKIGLEYNYGSKYWTNISQHMTGSKLNTRGSVLEGYLIFTPTLPEQTSKYLEDFLVRVGYQHYWYDYTYSGMWLGAPLDIDDLDEDPMYAQFYDPADEEYVFYLAVDIYF